LFFIEYEESGLAGSNLRNTGEYHVRKIAYSLIGLTFAATAAYAQPASDPAGAAPPPDASAPADAVPPSDVPPAEPAPGDAVPPAEPAPPSDPLADGSATAGATFTDAEIDSFAAATVEVQKIDADATLDAAAKQSKMAAAVTGAGIDPAKYNEIGQALATDTELRAKVQTAMAKHAGPPAG
jgi:hypothetical protein